jgi:PrcB C-terminal
VLAAVCVAAAGWILYAHAWRDGGARVLPFRDVTSQLQGLQPAREANRVFVNELEVFYYLRFADPGHVVPLPSIDFTRDEAVFVSTGPRSSTGYRIHVVGVVEERGRVVVTLQERTPSLADPGRPTATYPYRLVVFRKVDKPVHIVWPGRP